MAGKLAGSGKGRGGLDVNADPNVIPFIDIMLVLLIIFMIAAPISSVDIKVQMPKSQIDPSHRPPRPTWISVKEDNAGVQYFVMNDQVQVADLGQKTYEAWERNSPGVDFRNDCQIPEHPNAACRIYIRADSNTQYRNVVRVMNRLQDRGFMHIAFVAEDRR
jgi:biopolymer transport protein ExbD